MAKGKNTESKKICEFPGCGRPYLAKGLCCGHYGQARSGKQLRPLYYDQRPAGSAPVITYIEAPCPVEGLVGPCHIWQKCKSTAGYGQVAVNGVMIYTHRFLWEQTHGRIADGMYIDHRCGVRACCNVDHLRVVTLKVNATENVKGGSIGQRTNAGKTHCPHGHEYTKENTYINPKGSRECRTCLRARAAARRAARKAVT